jgi:hypothetical protein
MYLETHDELRANLTTSNITRFAHRLRDGSDICLAAARAGSNDARYGGFVSEGQPMVLPMAYARVTEGHAGCAPNDRRRVRQDPYRPADRGRR